MQDKNGNFDMRGTVKKKKRQSNFLKPQVMYLCGWFRQINSQKSKNIPFVITKDKENRQSTNLSAETKEYLVFLLIYQLSNWGKVVCN